MCCYCKNYQGGQILDHGDQDVTPQDYYNYPEVQLANTSYDSNCYFANCMNSHIGVASHNDSRYVASADTYVVNVLHHTNHNSGYYAEEPMSTMHI